MSYGPCGGQRKALSPDAPAAYTVGVAFENAHSLDTATWHATMQTAPRLLLGPPPPLLPQMWAVASRFCGQILWYGPRQMGTVRALSQAIA